MSVHSFQFRGGMYILDSGSVTLAGANASAGAAGTIKLVNGVYNPRQTIDYQNRWLSIVYAVIATVSGTPAGPFYWNVQQLPAGVSVTTAATGTINSALAGYPSGSVAKPLVNVAVVRSDAGTGNFTQLATIGGPTAVAATGANETAVEETKGRIIVPPGAVFGIAATGAGTSHIVQSSIYWEELSSSPL